MYLVDYHSHTRCSPDSTAELADMAAAALDVGLVELCTTDHYDLLDLDGNPAPALDWAPILAQYRAAAQPLTGKLKLRLGLELGAAQVDPPRAVAALAGVELDFIIGSVHNQSPAKGGHDLYFLTYDTPQDCHAALADYFDSLAALVALDCYDVVGHVIYPLRYMQKFPGHPVTLAGYEDRMRGLFTQLAQAGRGIEFNTWHGHTLDDWLPILQLYRACGGELVTVGSDAHVPNHVGRGAAQAQELLRQAGFRYLTVFDRRRPQFIRL